MTDSGGKDIRPSAMQLLLETYAEDLALVNRYFDIPLARMDLDEKRQFFECYRKTLAGLPFDPMGQTERIDYLLFKTKLDYELRKLAIEEKRNQEIAPWVPFAQTICGLEQQRRGMEPIESSGVAAQLADMPEQIERLRDASQIPDSGDDVGPGQRTLVHRAAAMTDALRKTLQPAAVARTFARSQAR